MKVFLLLCLVCFCSSHSQVINVLDSETGQPVAFANIIFKAGEKVVHADYTDERGSLQLANVTAYSTMEISCVGYTTQELLKDKINGNILLSPQVNLLDEVEVKFSRPVLLGEMNMKKQRQVSLDKMRITACFFKNTFAANPLVKSVLFKVDKVYYKTAVRIHLYSRQDCLEEYYPDGTSEGGFYETFFPETDLLANNVVYYIEPQDKGIVEIDLSEYNVLMPENGIFVGIECLGYYDYTGNLIAKADKPTQIEMHQTQRLLLY